MALPPPPALPGPTHVAWRTEASTVEALFDDAHPIRVRGVPIARGQRVEVLALTIAEAADLELQLQAARVYVARRRTAASNPDPVAEAARMLGFDGVTCPCGHGPAWHHSPSAVTCQHPECGCTRPNH